MINEKRLENFLISCNDCKQAGREHQTHLHIDWKKKYYMVLCFTCNKTEAFNEKGECLILKPENENGSKKEDEKIVN